MPVTKHPHSTGEGQKVAAPKEHQINGTRHTANISGAFDFDWNAYSQFVLTPTGATTLGNTNLPTGTNSKEIKGIIKAGSAVTLPANWVATADSDAFDNTKDNHIRAWVSAENVVTFTNKNKAVTGGEGGGVNQAYVDQGDANTLQDALDADAALSENVVHIEGDETIIGHKTFTGISRFDREFYIKKSENGLEPLLGYMQIGMFGDNIIQFVASSVGINSEIGFDIGQVTGYREYVLPDKDGTVALLSDIVETSRTIKLVPNTTQYTLVAADFITNSLRFTANGGQTINVLLNAGVQPVNGSLQIVIEGDCKLNFTYGTGVSAILPPGAIGTTLGKGSWIGSEYVSANVISWNGDLDGEGGGTTAITNITQIPNRSYNDLQDLPTRPEKLIVSYGEDINYTLQLEDKNRFLNIRTLDDTLGFIKITIPPGVFANGDVIKGYDHFGFKKVSIISNMNFIRTRSGSWSGTKEFVLDGYFELRIVSTSSSGPANAFGAVLTGDIIQEYEIRQSPNGTLWKVSVNDSGVEVITAL